MNYVDQIKGVLKSLNVDFIDPCDPNYTGASTGGGGTGTAFSCTDLAGCSLANLGTKNYSDLSGVPTLLSQFTNDILTNTANSITFGGVTVKAFECSDLGTCSLADLQTANFSDLDNLPTLTQNGGNVTGSINLSTGEFALTAPAGGTAPVTSVNGEVGVVVLDTSDIAETADARYMTDAQEAKLDALDPLAEQNVQSDWNQTDNTADDFIKNKINPYTTNNAAFINSVVANSYSTSVVKSSGTVDELIKITEGSGISIIQDPTNSKGIIISADTAPFAWYDSGIKGIKTYSTGAVTVVENTPGDYSIDGTTELVDRISYNVFTSGGTQNAASGATIFKLSTATGNNNYTDTATPYAKGIDSTTGQVKDMNGTLSSTNSLLAVPSAGVLTLTLNGFAGAFPDGSKMTVFNLISE